MNATPVPVVSSRYVWASAPPKTIVASRPALRAMLVKENPGGSASCRGVAPPRTFRIASARIANVAGRKARKPGTRRMLPLEIRGEATRGLVLRERLGAGAA